MTNCDSKLLIDHFLIRRVTSNLIFFFLTPGDWQLEQLREHAGAAVADGVPRFRRLPLRHRRHQPEERGPAERREIPLQGGQVRVVQNGSRSHPSFFTSPLTTCFPIVGLLAALCPGFLI